MPNFSSASIRLIEFWRAQGLRIATPAIETELQSFERREQVCIPLEFREYLLSVNGMLQEGSSDCDQNLFAFWPLARIKSVQAECPDSHDDAIGETFFVFADYMVWSWAYAIEMSILPAETGRVILVGALHPQVVAQSFTEFVGLYISDAPEIYPKQ